MSFYIGQQVICVKSLTGCAVVGRTYTVSGVSACACRTQLQCVGVSVRPERLNSTRCNDCGTLIGSGKWTRSNFFRPLDTLTETMERIEKEGCPLELEHA